MSDNQQVLVPVDLFNALTNYLTSRPYSEVHQIISEMRQSVKVVEAPPEALEESESAVEPASDE